MNQLRIFMKSTTFAYLMITLSAILYVFGMQALMSPAKSLPAGLGAFALLPGVVHESLAKYFTFFYLALNLPLIAIFWKSIKKKFLIRTIYFLLITTVFGALQMIPQVNDFFTGTLQQLIVKAHSFPDHALERTTYELVWPMLVLPAIAGAMVGAAVALSWKYGGSTAGSDIVVYYFSTKKKKQVGTISMYVSLVILFSTFGIFLGLNNVGIKQHWFASLAGSFIYIVISGMVVNAIFPKYRKVSVEVHSTKMAEIRASLDKTYIHAYRIEESMSSRHKVQKTKPHIVTVMLQYEIKDFVKTVKEIDSDAWISVTRVESVFGKFNTSAVE